MRGNAYMRVKSSHMNTPIGLRITRHIRTTCTLSQLHSIYIDIELPLRVDPPPERAFFLSDNPPSLYFPKMCSMISIINGGSGQVLFSMFAFFPRKMFPHFSDFTGFKGININYMIQSLIKSFFVSVCYWIWFRSIKYSKQCSKAQSH